MEYGVTVVRITNVDHCYIKTNLICDFEFTPGFLSKLPLQLSIFPAFLVLFSGVELVVVWEQKDGLSCWH